MTDILEQAKEKIDGLQDSLGIDKDDLDNALQEQAATYHAICTEHAYALSRRDQAAEETKRVDAQLNIDVRKVFDNSGEKVTEAKVSSEVMLSLKHQNAYDDHQKAVLAAALWQALKDSFHQRSYMLREMTGLYISGYWIGDANHKETAVHIEKRNTTRRSRSV